jgi:hypothetical protein
VRSVSKATSTIMVAFFFTMPTSSMTPIIEITFRSGQARASSKARAAHAAVFFTLRKTLRMILRSLSERSDELLVSPMELFPADGLAWSRAPQSFLRDQDVTSATKPTTTQKQSRNGPEVCRTAT